MNQSASSGVIIVYNGKHQTLKWKRKTSTFDLHILNKEKLAFIVETEDNIRYGGFVYSKIDKYKTIDEKMKIVTLNSIQGLSIQLNW